MTNELLTVTQAASYLRVCDKTVRRLIASKQLTASKVGRTWRIKREEIDDYLQSTTNKSAVRAVRSDANFQQDGVRE